MSRWAVRLTGSPKPHQPFEQFEHRDPMRAKRARSGVHLVGMDPMMLITSPLLRSPSDESL